MEISVVIPTLNPSPTGADALQEALACQTLPHELVVVDSASEVDPRTTWSNAEVIHRIPKNEFGHGRTRNLGASLASGEFLVFLTQDALPIRNDWLATLAAAVRSGEASAAYGRQLPTEDSTPLETFARQYNYPNASVTRTAQTIQGLGIEAYFFSNVCSLVRRQAFFEVGAFPADTIVNEDLILAAKLLHAGHNIRYEAKAAVLHSHDYTLREQFGRNFDIGVAVIEAADQLENTSSTRAGLSFIGSQIRYLASTGELMWIPKAFLEAATKFTAFHLGKRHRALPLALKKMMSMHSYYWDQQPRERRSSATT